MQGFSTLWLYAACCSHHDIPTERKEECPDQYKNVRCCSRQDFLALVRDLPARSSQEAESLLWTFLRDVDLSSLEAWSSFAASFARRWNQESNLEGVLILLPCQVYSLVLNFKLGSETHEGGPVWPCTCVLCTCWVACLRQSTGQPREKHKPAISAFTVRQDSVVCLIAIPLARVRLGHWPAASMRACERKMKEVVVENGAAASCLWFSRLALRSRLLALRRGGLQVCLQSNRSPWLRCFRFVFEMIPFSECEWGGVLLSGKTRQSPSILWRS